jgi:hypothetical protein
MLKALVISDDVGRLRDLGDVLAVARAEGKKLFRTSENIGVLEVFKSFYSGKPIFIVVVEFNGCSDRLGVSLGKTN